MEKIITIRTLIIVRNTHLPVKADYIISAKDIDGKYYAATTNTRSVYDQFWNETLTDEQKVPAITHLLYCLGQEYAESFCYIQPNKISTDAE